MALPSCCGRRQVLRDNGEEKKENCNNENSQYLIKVDIDDFDVFHFLFVVGAEVERMSFFTSVLSRLQEFNARRSSSASLSRSALVLSLNPGSSVGSRRAVGMRQTCVST